MDLLSPQRLYSREEVLARPSPVPQAPGVYAWYFRNIPSFVPLDGCVQCGDLTLLYVGIAPRAAPKNGKPPSSQRLRHRVRYHFCGNGTRLTFAEGEAALSHWMLQNAFVVWQVTEEPWNLEREIIGKTALPLNLDMNRGHAFHSSLSTKRRLAKQAAREGAIWRPKEAIALT